MVSHCQHSAKYLQKTPLRCEGNSMMWHFLGSNQSYFLLYFFRDIYITMYYLTGLYWKFNVKFDSLLHKSHHKAGKYHFYPRPVLAFGYCRCLRLSVCPSVRVCGNHLLVRAITRHPFKLGSPNLDHRCKRPWLRSLLFWGVIDLDLQGQIKLQSQKLPHFELLGTITHHLFKLGSPNMGKRCKIPGLRLLLTLGLIDLDLQFHFQFWNPFS